MPKLRFNRSDYPALDTARQQHAVDIKAFIGERRRWRVKIPSPGRDYQHLEVSGQHDIGTTHVVFELAKRDEASGDREHSPCEHAIAALAQINRAKARYRTWRNGAAPESNRSYGRSARHQHPNPTVNGGVQKIMREIRDFGAHGGSGSDYVMELA